MCSAQSQAADLAAACIVWPSGLIQVHNIDQKNGIFFLGASPHLLHGLHKSVLQLPLCQLQMNWEISFTFKHLCDIQLHKCVFKFVVGMRESAREVRKHEKFPFSKHFISCHMVTQLTKATETSLIKVEIMVLETSHSLWNGVSPSSPLWPMSPSSKHLLVGWLERNIR
jgi:hypothetical protein